MSERLHRDAELHYQLFGMEMIENYVIFSKVTQWGRLALTVHHGPRNHGGRVESYLLSLLNTERINQSYVRPRAAGILNYLILRPGHLISVPELWRAAFPDERNLENGGFVRVRTHMHELRKSLSQLHPVIADQNLGLIKNIFGRGYLLTPD